MTPRLLLAGILCLLCSSPTSSQSIKMDTLNNRYILNKWVSAGIGVAGTVANYTGLSRLRNKAVILEQEILALDNDDVNRFDQYALRQDFSKYKDARLAADIGLYASFLFPGLLFFDDDIRSEWVEVSLLYFETQAIAATLYSWSPLGPMFNDRFRPFTYYAEAPLEERMAGKMRNSFFSGHVATAATGTFFAAKVYSDYHPELGAKKWLYFGLALVPPAFVGLYRIKSLNHFPTDTVVGTLVGAAGGILIPHFHRNKSWNGGVSFIYRDGVKGAVLVWRF